MAADQCYKNQFTKHAFPFKYTDRRVWCQNHRHTKICNIWNWSCKVSVLTTLSTLLVYLFCITSETLLVEDALLACHARSGRGRGDTCQRFTCLSCGSPPLPGSEVLPAPLLSSCTIAALCGYQYQYHAISCHYFEINEGRALCGYQPIPLFTTVSRKGIKQKLLLRTPIFLKANSFQTDQFQYYI